MKMIKKIKRLLNKRNNGGFTLVEVIVSAALLGVLLIGIMMFIRPVTVTVMSEETNARASNTASTIEHYLSRSLRNAVQVAIYTDCTFSDMGVGNTLVEPVISKMYNDFINGKDTYELKCLSIRYGYDRKSQTYKYFICNERVNSGAITLNAANNNNYNLNEDYLAFETCYFDDLYFKMAISQPTDMVDATKLRPVLQMDINCYDDSSMDDTSLVFVGKGYTEMLNIKVAQASKDLNLDYKIHPITSLGTGDDIFIYYVSRKLK